MSVAENIAQVRACIEESAKKAGVGQRTFA